MDAKLIYKILKSRNSSTINPILITPSNSKSNILVTGEPNTNKAILAYEYYNVYQTPNELLFRFNKEV